MAAVTFKGYYFLGDYDILMPGHKGVYCDGKSHPSVGFRPYKRGFNRCATCGARKGLVMDFDYLNQPLTNSNL